MSHIIKTIIVVGLGSIGRRHVRIVQKLFPKIRIVAIRHKRCEKNDIDKLGIFKCVTSVEEAIDYSPQAAILANPATAHLDIAEKLANNGINILIEKPISNSSEGVQKLIDVCQRNNCVLMTGYNLRFLPSLIEFRKQVLSNKIGRIFSVRSEVGQYLPSWRPGYDYKNSVSANESLGGGVLLELSHEIDYLSWIFGSINWIKSHVSKQSDLDIDVEDSAKIILGFKGTEKSELIGSLNMDFIRHDTTRKCYAIGKKGTLCWNGISGKVKYFAKGDSHWETVFSSNVDTDYTYTEEIKSFFSAIDSNEMTHASGYNGLQAVIIVEAIIKSNNINSIVYL